jgi:hypothetical protein
MENEKIRQRDSIDLIPSEVRRVQEMELIAPFLSKFT